MNDHALKTIEMAQAPKTHSLTELILRPFNTKLAARAIVAETFADAMSVLEAQIRRIRLEAEEAAIRLTKLEQSLVTLHETLTRENITLTNEKEELLAELWTKLGGNKKKVRGVDNHLWLLQRIGDWRSRAQVHVVATMQALDSMSEDMEDMRERVSRPELIGENLPPEVHMKSIQAGLERLKFDRNRTKKKEEENLRRILSIDEDEM